MDKKIKIFILDDVELIGKQMATVLNKTANYEALYFTTMKELYANIDPKNPPDVLLIDYLLNEGTCENVIRDLRKLIPAIICVTGTDAFTKADTITSLYKAGATDIKPKTNLNLVYRSVHTVVRRRETEVFHKV